MDTPIEDLLEFARNPAKYQEILDQLKELRNGKEMLARGMEELQIREQAAAALMADANRIKAEFERRAVGLDALKAFAREQTGQ
jgi:hypothetical protein